MSKNPKPTSEELRFIFDLFLKGNTDSDILAEYAHLYELGQLPFTYRTDKRFVKEKRKEFEAANEVLQEYVKKKADPVIAERRIGHFDHLAFITSVLLKDGLDDYWANFYDEDEGLMKNRLSDQLNWNYWEAQDNLGYLEIDSYFMPHIIAEYPDIGAKGWKTAVKENPFAVIEILNILLRRKTFNGTCPICQDW